MFITICLIILGYMIVGKDVKPWVEKLNSVDWKSKADKVINMRFRQLVVPSTRRNCRGRLHPLSRFC